MRKRLRKRTISILLAASVLCNSGFAISAQASDNYDILTAIYTDDKNLPSGSAAENFGTLSDDTEVMGVTTNNPTWEVLKLCNKERLKKGLKPLSLNGTITGYAQTRANEIITLFDHTRPNGSRCFTVLDNYPYFYAGENIAKGYTDSASVVEAWMDSEGHRKNILNTNFNHLGVGLATNSSGKKHWAQMFVGCGNSTTMGKLWEDLNDGFGYYRVGSSIDSMSIMCDTVCEDHGTMHIPVIKEMVTGYNPSAEGQQMIYVNYNGTRKPYTIYLHPFRDVGNSWYTEAVYKVNRAGIMTGTSPDLFSISTNLSRAQFVVILYRMANEPSVTYTNRFSDVPNGLFYSKAAIWAANVGITTGYADGTFRPGDPINREQLVLMMHRYANYKHYNTSQATSLSGYSDRSAVSSFAKTAMEWAIATGIITGKAGNKLDPLGYANRAESAVIINRFMNYYHL